MLFRLGENDRFAHVVSILMPDSMIHQITEHFVRRILIKYVLIDQFRGNSFRRLALLRKFIFIVFPVSFIHLLRIQSFLRYLGARLNQVERHQNVI